MKNITHVIYWLIIISIAFDSFANILPIRINLTGSMPRGIYWLTTSPEIHKGDFVMVCLNNSLASFAQQRGYLSAGHCANHVEPLLKQVVAHAGDTVTLSNDFIWINNKTLSHTATLAIDKHGRKLPVIKRGIYTLGSNQLWLYGTDSARSWDSRYFGAIDSSLVINTVNPIFTWSEG
jgi:conjugative transfer signal peptidase TraF